MFLGESRLCFAAVLFLFWIRLIVWHTSAENVERPKYNLVSLFTSLARLLAHKIVGTDRMIARRDAMDTHLHVRLSKTTFYSTVSKVTAFQRFPHASNRDLVRWIGAAGGGAIIS